MCATYLVHLRGFFIPKISLTVSTDWRGEEKNKQSSWYDNTNTYISMHANTAQEVAPNQMLGLGLEAAAIRNGANRNERCHDLQVRQKMSLLL